VQLADGTPLLRANIRLPRVGVWHGNVEILTATKLSGKVTLVSSAGLSLTGTIKEAEVVRDVLQARIVGGAAGMPTETGPKFYESMTFGHALRELLGEVGETLSPTSDATATGTALARWVRMAGSASDQLDQIVRKLGVDWRVLPDGTVWVGKDTFPTIQTSGPGAPEFTLIDERGDRAFYMLGVEDAWLVPGVTFLDKKIGYVVHLIDDRARTEAYFE